MGYIDPTSSRGWYHKVHDPLTKPMGHQPPWRQNDFNDPVHGANFWTELACHPCKVRVDHTFLLTEFISFFFLPNDRAIPSSIGLVSPANYDPPRIGCFTDQHLDFPDPTVKAIICVAPDDGDRPIQFQNSPMYWNIEMLLAPKRLTVDPTFFLWTELVYFFCCPTMVPPSSSIGLASPANYDPVRFECSTLC